MTEVKDREKWCYVRKVAQAAIVAPEGSATKRGLWAAYNKHQTVADAIDFIEEEKEHNDTLRKTGFKK